MEKSKGINCDLKQEHKKMQTGPQCNWLQTFIVVNLNPKLGHITFVEIYHEIIPTVTEHSPSFLSLNFRWFKKGSCYWRNYVHKYW